jgi:HSP20 family protein
MASREVEDFFWQVGSNLQRLNEELQRSRPGLAQGKFWQPNVDLMEDERRFLLKAEISGVRGEDIQLLYLPERHSMLVRGMRREEDIPEDGGRGWHQLEIPYGQFAREVRLPDIPIDADNIRAQYRNGFLLVVIPKQERVVVGKTISITGL